MIFDLSNVTEIEYYWSSKDLSKLCSYKNLASFSIDVYESNVDSLALLSTLEKLKSLTLFHGNVETLDVSCISSSTQLTNLSLCGFCITDLPPLSSLRLLANLTLNDTIIYSLKPLQNLETNHRSYVYGRTQVNDLFRFYYDDNVQLDLSQRGRYRTINLSVLSGAELVKALYLAFSHVDNTSIPSNFANLQLLDLSVFECVHQGNSNIIYDFSKCTKLQSLVLSHLLDVRYFSFVRTL
ncbi:hypothetical protein RCL1_007322 [Eukaryota sp. TZLM3-RCL]